MVPFLKWPGGKRWFVPRHADLLPHHFNRYFEPFVGGGSVFFHLEPPSAVLADTNAELINVYRAVASRWKRLVTLLAHHQAEHGERYYYRVRDQVPAGVIERAARTIYLNRTCVNGIPRLNGRAEFNS